MFANAKKQRPSKAVGLSVEMVTTMPAKKFTRKALQSALDKEFGSGAVTVRTCAPNVMQSPSPTKREGAKENPDLNAETDPT